MTNETGALNLHTRPIRTDVLQQAKKTFAEVPGGGGSSAGGSAFVLRQKLVQKAGGEGLFTAAVPTSVGGRTSLGCHQS